MYEHVMVPLDGSELAECVLPHLEAMAKSGHISRVTLVSIVEPIHIHRGLEFRLPSDEKTRLEQMSMEKSRDYLNRIAKRIDCGGATVETEVLHGHIAKELGKYVETNDIDLVMVSTHGQPDTDRGIWGRVRRWRWWNVIEHLLRSCGVPVLIVRPSDVRW